jgi:putative toxin-antitoxin system antitoxin component (TIGR02293 family)
MSHTERVVELLGGRKALGANLPRTELDLHPLVVRGLPMRAFDLASRELEVSQQDLDRFLNLKPRTLARRRKEHRLSVVESERFLRLVRVVARGEEVLGERASARAWVRRPNRALGSRAPFELLETDVGFQAVMSVLGRIEHGVFS